MKQWEKYAEVNYYFNQHEWACTVRSGLQRTLHRDGIKTRVWTEIVSVLHHIICLQLNVNVALNRTVFLISLFFPIPSSLPSSSFLYLSLFLSLFLSLPPSFPLSLIHSAVGRSGSSVGAQADSPSGRGEGKGAGKRVREIQKEREGEERG